MGGFAVADRQLENEGRAETGAITVGGETAAQFLGGTSLLIVIQVMLDFVSRIEANLVMRNYSGFMDNDGGGSSAKIRRPKGGPARGPKQPQPAAEPMWPLPRRLAW